MDYTANRLEQLKREENFLTGILNDLEVEWLNLKNRKEYSHYTKMLKKDITHYTKRLRKVIELEITCKNIQSLKA